MLILLPILLVLSAYYLSRFIRTNSIIIYLLALFISATSIMLPTSHYTEIINNGTLGISFLLIVMLTGAFKSGSKIKNQLSRVRREFAILGFIFITPHAYNNIYGALINQIPLSLYAVLAFVLMIPLFVTSFKVVRKNIKTSSWLSLHKWAYLIYVLIFIHAISVSSLPNIIAYYIIFCTYFFLKIYHRSKSYNLLKATTITILLGSSSLLFINDASTYFDEPYDIIEGNNFQNGTYIGYSKGYHNIDTVVRVEIQNNEITYVVVENCGCTPFVDDDYYASVAFTIANEIKETNRTDVDEISGATQTSSAINEAVINALKLAIIE